MKNYRPAKPSLPKLRSLLEEGKTVRQAAELCNISARRAYQLVTAHKLPTNPTVKPGAALELRILKAFLVSRSLKETASLFSLSDAAIHRVLRRNGVKVRRGNAKSAA